MSNTMFVYRSVPGAREKELKGKRKKRDIHRARVLRRSLVIRLVILLHEYWWQTCSLFVLSKLANRRELYIYISVFKIRSQYVANVCKA